MLALLSTPELAKIYIDLSHEYHFPILIWRLGPGERAAKWLKPLMDAAPTSFVNPFMIQREFPGPRGSIDEMCIRDSPSIAGCANLRAFMSSQDVINRISKPVYLQDHI